MGVGLSVLPASWPYTRRVVLGGSPGGRRPAHARRAPRGAVVVGRRRSHPIVASLRFRRQPTLLCIAGRRHDDARSLRDDQEARLRVGFGLAPSPFGVVLMSGTGARAGDAPEGRRQRLS